MKFIARLRGYVTGNIYHGEFNASTFDTAWDDARRAFPKHKVMTIYPEDMMARMDWAFRGATATEPCQKCQRLEQQIDRMNKEILALQISNEMIAGDRAMLLRQLNGEEQHES